MATPEAQQPAPQESTEKLEQGDAEMKGSNASGNMAGNIQVTGGIGQQTVVNINLQYGDAINKLGSTQSATTAEDNKATSTASAPPDAMEAPKHFACGFGRVFLESDFKPLANLSEAIREAMLKPLGVFSLTRCTLCERPCEIRCYVLARLPSIPPPWGPGAVLRYTVVLGTVEPTEIPGLFPEGGETIIINPNNAWCEYLKAFPGHDTSFSGKINTSQEGKEGPIRSPKGMSDEHLEALFGDDPPFNRQPSEPQVGVEGSISNPNDTLYEHLKAFFRDEPSFGKAYNSKANPNGRKTKAKKSRKSSKTSSSNLLKRAAALVPTPIQPVLVS